MSSTTCSVPYRYRNPCRTICNRVQPACCCTSLIPGMCAATALACQPQKLPTVRLALNHDPKARKRERTFDKQAHADLHATNPHQAPICHYCLVRHGWHAGTQARTLTSAPAGPSCQMSRRRDSTTCTRGKRGECRTWQAQCIREHASAALAYAIAAGSVAGSSAAQKQ